MNCRRRPRYRPHFSDQFLKTKFLRQHIIKIISSTNLTLNPRVIQILFSLHSICVTVRRHLRNEIVQVPETEAAVPSGVGKYQICLARVAVTSPPAVKMSGCPPAIVINRKLKRVKVISHFKMQNRRQPVAQPEKINGVGTWNLVDQKIAGDVGSKRGDSIKKGRYVHQKVGLMRNTLIK